MTKFTLKDEDNILKKLVVSMDIALLLTLLISELLNHLPILIHNNSLIEKGGDHLLGRSL